MAALPPGIYAPVPTLFVRKTSSTYNPATAPLDDDAQGAYLTHLARSGVVGAVLLGSTGEAVHLTTAERVQLIAAARRNLAAAGYPNYPLLAGTTIQSVSECEEHLTAAHAAGANWELCLVPGYFTASTSQAGIIRWFETVADRSPMPVLVYHYPGVSNNVKPSAVTIEKLAKHPNIVGCKLSHGDVATHGLISRSNKIDHTQFATFTGLGQQLLQVMAMGAAGAIDGTAGFFPKSVVRLYELCAAADSSAIAVAERQSLQAKVSAVEELVVAFGVPGIKEAVSRVLGYGDRDGTQLPLIGGIPGGDQE